MGRCQSIEASWTAEPRQLTCGIMRPVEVRSVGNLRDQRLAPQFLVETYAKPKSLSLI